MGGECSRFVSALASKLCINEEYSVVISWLRVRLSNSKILVLYVRCSSHIKDDKMGEDFRLIYIYPVAMREN